MNAVLRNLAVAVCLAVSSTAVARPVVPLCPANPPQIDGVIAAGEWDSAQQIDIQVNVPEGGTAPARLYLMNDSRDLFVAMRVARTAVDDATTFSFNLDTNYDRELSEGDDNSGVTYDPYSGSVAFDNVYYTGGACPSLCGGSDVDQGGTNDVTAAVTADGTYVTYELTKPLLPTDHTHDATMLAETSLAMTFALRLLAPGAEWPNGIADTYYPSVPSAGLYVDFIIRRCGGIDF